jgi:L-ascorbate metabolism protein UlaG (beta-lactamase superfamily)
VIPASLAAQPGALSGVGGSPASAFFVGNEGVVLMGTRSVVLIDALFGEGIDGYRTVKGDLRKTFEGAFPSLPGSAPLVLATHHHRDHFDPEAVVAYLVANPEGRFLSTPLAIDEIAALSPPTGVLERTLSVFPEEGERVSFEFGEVRVRVLNLHHGRERTEIQNLGLLIDIGGALILHMGDTQVTPNEILGQEIRKENLEAAFVPYWLLLGDDGPGIIGALGAHRIFAIHLPRADAAEDWWGALGSLEATVEFLSSLEGVTPITEDILHPIVRMNKHGLILRRKDTWPDTSRITRSNSSGN